MTLSQDLHRLQEQHLKRTHDLYTLNSQWLTECYEYLASQRTPGSILHKDIYDQFLGSSLQDSCIPSLPQDSESLHNQPLFTAHPVVLELRDIHDIGVSTSSLLDKLMDSRVNEHRRVLDVSQDETLEGETLSMTTQSTQRATRVSLGKGPTHWRTPGSCLSLVLSDGVECIKAIEKQPIQGLDISLPMGTKVHILSLLVI